MTRLVRTTYLGLLLLASGCEGWKTPGDPPLSLDAELRQRLGGQYGVVPIVAPPTQPPALVTLGQALMFDKVLSGNRDIACATCHTMAAHATDGITISIGTGGTGTGASRTLGPGRQFIPRNAPTLLNTGLGAFYLFLDGRVSGVGAGFFNTPAGAALPPCPRSRSAGRCSSSATKRAAAAVIRGPCSAGTGSPMPACRSSAPGRGAARRSTSVAASSSTRNSIVSPSASRRSATWS